MGDDPDSPGGNGTSGHMAQTDVAARQALPSVAAAAIGVAGLTKRFGDVVAVDDVSFDVARGEVFAFLGPNGAGKSTTINVLCTLTAPSQGSARVAGFDVVADQQAVRQRIGLVF